jgi:hypothetical protein
VLHVPARDQTAHAAPHTASLTAFDGAAAVITGRFSLDTLLYGLSIQRIPKRRKEACYTFLTTRNLISVK